MRPAPAAPPPAAPEVGSGQGEAIDVPPPGNAAAAVTASLDRTAAPEKSTMAPPPAAPLPIKAAAPPGPRSPRFGSVDSRSLDQLFARIAAAR
jgi:hypothetical protein